MKKIILSVCLFILGMSAFAQQDAETWFDQANAAYNEGRYDTAMILYQSVLDADVESASLYCNMGDAQYKLRNYPMAIYYYEKALKLDPGYDDARHNLKIANLAIVDKIEPVPQSFIARGWNKVKNLHAADGWAVLSLAFFALLLISLFVFFRSRRMGLRKTGFFVAVLSLLLFAFSVIFALQSHHDLQSHDAGIVMAPTVTVKSSPNESSVDLFVLHEGTKVEVMEESESWLKIKIANGSVGWMPSSSLATL